ncbi:Uncharacterised protein [Providencia rettgeri]|nr:Uncharacterised protein [Providencia rettgeri]
MPTSNIGSSCKASINNINHNQKVVVNLLIK